MCLAIPGNIIAMEDDSRRFATVDVSGVRRRVNIELLLDEKLAPGDWVLIHVGFAMSKISADEAAEQIELLTMMGEAGEARREIEGYSFDDDS